MGMLMIYRVGVRMGIGYGDDFPPQITKGGRFENVRQKFSLSVWKRKKDEMA